MRLKKSKGFNVYSVEFTHNGVRRFMETDARTEQSARQTFAAIAKQANAPVEIHYDTLKHHLTAESLSNATKAFRTALGKSPAPNEDELRANAAAVLSKPVPDEDDDE